MAIHIRQFRQDDQVVIAHLMTELQTHITAVDPLKRNRCEPKYGECYAGDVIQRVENDNGIILVADLDAVVVGYVAIIFDTQSEIDLLGEFPLKDARVIELVVRSDMRGQGVGAKLMDAAEDFARIEECNGIRVEVFAPNTSAAAFYQKLGYADRCVDMLKIF